MRHRFNSFRPLSALEFSIGEFPSPEACHSWFPAAAKPATLCLVGRRSALAGPHPAALHERFRLLPMSRELTRLFV